MNLLCELLFFCKGIFEFTGWGYKRASSNFNPDDLKELRLTGKIALVTGANSGIGFQCCLDLARFGASVHMVCRNIERAEDAKRKIVLLAQNEDVHIHIVDLTDTRSVVEFAASFATTYKRLDILINNGSCILHDRQENADGIEANFATNTLAPYVLTNELIGLLKASLDPRVITVSWGYMLTQKLNSSDPQLAADSPFDGVILHAQQKRQQVVMTEMWAAAHPDVFFASMHPGWVDTPAFKTSLPNFHYWTQNNLRSTVEGADTAIWLAAYPFVNKELSGCFFQDRRPTCQHLSYVCTKSTLEDKQQFMRYLEDLYCKLFVTPRTPTPSPFFPDL